MTMTLHVRARFLIHLTLLALAALAKAATSSALDTYWYEVRPELTQYDMDKDFQFQSKLQPRRRLLWYGRYDEEMTWRPEEVEPVKRQSKRPAGAPAPHPLRTDLWNLNILWRGQMRGSDTLVEFHPNGYCRSPALGIGTWEVYPWGVRCTLREDNDVDDDGVEYTLYATLHLNPFGEHPKMIQGTIVKYEGQQEDPIQDHFFVRRRLKWFRPVVATFSGEGIGVDTADFSYSNRGIGPRQRCCAPSFGWALLIMSISNEQVLGVASSETSPCQKIIETSCRIYQVGLWLGRPDTSEVLAVECDRDDTVIVYNGGKYQHPPLFRLRVLPESQVLEFFVSTLSKRAEEKSRLVAKILSAVNLEVYVPMSSSSSSTYSVHSFLGRREVLATLTVVPLTYWYWGDLVDSLDGNKVIASLIVVGAWFGIAIDLNENMVGQPEADHHHHHHDD